MVTEEAAAGGDDQVFHPSGRAFFVYYLAIGICFFGPMINPKAGLDPWLGYGLGSIVVIWVAYRIWGLEYRVTPRGVVKAWRWPAREHLIIWNNLGGVWVRRGIVQSLTRVGNLEIKDLSGGPDMIWFGLDDPMTVKAIIDRRGL